MKLKYYSEMLDGLFDTAEALEAAEEAERKKKEAEEEKKATRAARAKEVEEAFKAVDAQCEVANQLLQDFIKDYGAFHTSITADNTFDTLVDRLFKLWL